MRSQLLDPLDPMFSNRFLSAFKLAFGTNTGHQCALLWLLHFFMNGPAVATLNTPIALHSKSNRRQKEGIFTFYCETANHLIKVYPKSDLIADLGTNIVHLAQPSLNSHTEYVSLWNKALQDDKIYD